MKKILSTIVLVNLIIVTNGQETGKNKLFQKVMAGVGITAMASTDFSEAKTPFTTGYNFTANVLTLTPRTYHSLLYGFGGNTLHSLNGFFLKKNWDTYLLYIKSLSTGGNYVGWGIEKMVKVEGGTEGIMCFTFAEVGTNLKGNRSLTVGLLITVQNRLWRRK